MSHLDDEFTSTKEVRFVDVGTTVRLCVCVSVYVSGVRDLKKLSIELHRFVSRLVLRRVRSN